MTKIFKTSVYTFPWIVVSMMIAACGGREMAKSTATVSNAVLEKVGGKRIFFGHQSVGFNIIDGIGDITKEKPEIRMNIVRTSDPDAFKSAVFGHATVGENDDPASKARDFEKYMEKGLGNNVDIAFYKYCYIDINKTSDVEKIFATYKETMGRLKKEYPRTKFVYVTVPLTVSKPSVKGFIKKMMGKEDNNIKRNRFNDMLQAEYGGKEPVFDLAKAESTKRNGERCTFNEGGKRYFSLVPEYSDDGGHLNENGRREVAAELLKVLASVE